jgi:hypothetical protein
MVFIELAFTHLVITGCKIETSRNFGGSIPHTNIGLIWINIECKLTAIRLWCIKFGAIYTRRLKRKHRGYGDTVYVDEVFAGMPDQKIHGKQHYLWRAVDQDGSAILGRQRSCLESIQPGQAPGCGRAL